MKTCLGVLTTALAKAAFGEQPINAATFDALPRFAPLPPPRLPLLPILWIAIVTIGLASVALLRLRRARPF